MERGGHSDMVSFCAPKYDCETVVQLFSGFRMTRKVYIILLFIPKKVRIDKKVQKQRDNGWKTGRILQNKSI